jgi:hypothetical protein
MTTIFKQIFNKISYVMEHTIVINYICIIVIFCLLLNVRLCYTLETNMII